MENANQPCCPKFEPQGWEGKTFSWNDRLFIKDNVRTFLHVPLNMGKVISRMWNRIQESHAETGMDNWLMLSYDFSPWRSEQFMPVAKEVPGAENVKISGNFICKVFEGPYQNAGKWHKETEEYIKSLGKQPKKIYFYYTTCPKCAKIHGKNYVVTLAEV